MAPDLGGVKSAKVRISSRWHWNRTSRCTISLLSHEVTQSLKTLPKEQTKRAKINKQLQLPGAIKDV